MSIKINKENHAQLWYPERLVIVGCGGIGSNLWDLIAHQTYYCAKLSNLGHPIRYIKQFLLMDADAVEPKNLFRQSFFSRHVGMAKSEALADKYKRQLNEHGIEVEHKREWLDSETMAFEEYDMIMLAVDNNATRKMLNDYISPIRQNMMRNVIAVNGGNSDALATVQVMVKTSREIHTATFEHMHPEITNPEDKHPSQEECTSSTAMADDPQTFRANQMAATMMFNVFVNAMESRAIDACMYWHDVAKMQFAKDPIPDKEIIID